MSNAATYIEGDTSDVFSRFPLDQVVYSPHNVLIFYGYCA